MPKSSRSLLALLTGIAVVLTGVLVPLGATAAPAGTAAPAAVAATPYPIAGVEVQAHKNDAVTPFILTAVVTGQVPGSTLKYQWFRVGLDNPSQRIAIKNATKQTYTPVAADYPYRISVRVTLTAAGYDAGVKDSLAKDYSIRISKPLLSSPDGLIVGESVFSDAPDIDRELSFSDSTGRTDASGDFALNRIWLADGKVIAGANGSELELTAAQRGKSITLQFKLNGTRQGYLSAPPVTSVATPKVGFGTLTDSFTADVSKSGQVLTAIPGGISSSGVTVSYQWYRENSKIAKATKSTYTLVQSTDHTKLVYVAITYSKPGYTSRTEWSNSWAYSVMVDTLPGIDGAPAVGEVLRIQPAIYYDGSTNTFFSPTVTYQFLVNGVAVTAPGTEDAEYQVRLADKGKRITVRATASYPGLFTSVTTSAATQPIGLAVQPGWTNEPTVAIDSSSTTTRTVLRATSGVTVPPAPAKLTYAYQWLRGGAPIKGATSATYVLTAADAGTFTSVRVTTTRAPAGAFTPSVQTSFATDWSIWASDNDAHIDTGGDMEVGRELEWIGPASFETWAGMISEERRFQWYRTLKGKTTAISGATAQTYTPTLADLGATMSVKVSVYKIGGGGNAWVATFSTPDPLEKVAKGGLSFAPGDPGMLRMAGAKLKAIPGGFTPTPTSYTYQWVRNGVDIPKATGQIYTLVEADRGKVITVRITALRAGYRDFPETPDPINVTFSNQAGLTLSGTPQVGLPLDATGMYYSDINMNPIPDLVHKVEWVKAGKVVGTGGTYTPVAADAGATLTMRVTVTAPGHVTLVETRTTSVPVAKGVTTGYPTIATVWDDSKRRIQASFSGLAPAVPAPGVTWQWYRSTLAAPGTVTKISGATSSAFTPTSADVPGTTLFVEVTFTRPGFVETSFKRYSPRTSWYITRASALTLPGTTAVGDTLSVESPTWRDYNLDAVTLTPSYVWFRGTTQVGTGASYVVKAADLGKDITVRETVVAVGHQGGTATSTKSRVGAGTIVTGGGIASVTMTNTSTRELTAAPQGVVTPGTTASYVWYRNNVAIKGATTNKYKLTAADTGKTVLVRITLKKPGFTTVTNAQAQFGNLIVPGTPTITPPLAYDPGFALTATVGTFTAPGNPSVTPTYQWQRDTGSGFADIAGATSGFYILTNDDLGTTLRVKVNGTATYYTSAPDLAAPSVGITIPN